MKNSKARHVDLVAQLVEQMTLNHWVEGSSPSQVTKGKVVEWSITAVLKTAVPRGTGGSNPSLSAIARRFFERGASFFCCKALKESGIRVGSQKEVISRLKAYDPFWRSTFGQSYATILLQKPLTKKL